MLKGIKMTRSLLLAALLALALTACKKEVTEVVVPAPEAAPAPAAEMAAPAPAAEPMPAAPMEEKK